MAAIIRLATPADAAQLAAIYAPIVRDTIISFEFVPPDEAELHQRVQQTLAQLPWLVAERDDAILGYAYASSHRTRAAYQWSVDVSVYVGATMRGQGIGRALYTALFQILRLQGFYNAYAGVTLPNAASVGLHEALGFRPVGVYRNVGYKMGAWHDVGWWQLALQPHQPAPEPPRPLAEVQQHELWAAALASGEALLSAPS
jgi:L-amino acid N-acyltransferase YncA